MAYVIWRVFFKKYSRFQLEFQRNPLAFVNPSKPAGKKPEEIAWNDTKSNSSTINDGTLIAATNLNSEGLLNSPADIEAADCGKNVDARRSKSRVRSYLKRCKDRITGGQQHNHTSSSNEEGCLQDFYHESSDSGGGTSTTWHIEENEPPDISTHTNDKTCDEAEIIAELTDTMRYDPSKVDYMRASTETLTEIKGEIHLKEVSATKWICDAVHMDSGIEELVDRYLCNVYPMYFVKTRSILVRQARDILVCTYHGDLQQFEDEFLMPVAGMLNVIKDKYSVGENFTWCKGWPLATENGSVILHLGIIDESLLRPQDIYLCFKPASATTPQLCAVWRTSFNNLKVIYRVIDSSKESLSPLAIEMLTDELPQLLQNLLVGVERAIGRITLNDLAFPRTPELQTTSASKISSTSESLEGGGGGGGGKEADPNAATKSNKSSCDKTITTNSPKCALKRSDLITKSRAMNTKYIFRRFSNRYDIAPPPLPSSQCESASSTIDAAGITSTSSSQSPQLPVFCLGGSFPHIDSDEENPSDERKSNGDNDTDNIQLPHEIVAPRSILELPEKLLTSGICLPGTRDLKGNPIITIDASNVIDSGLNCYEVATVLLYYSTIPERTSSFTVLLMVNGCTELSTVELLGTSLKLLVGHIQCDDLLVVFLQKHLKPNNNSTSTTASSSSGSSDYKIKYLSVDKISEHISASDTPTKCGGLHKHDQQKWRELFAIIDPFQSQCLATGQRLVAAMGDVRSSDLQGLPSRRQLYAQHRALSRALMDSELHYLRKRGAATINRLQELAKNLNYHHQHKTVLGQQHQQQQLSQSQLNGTDNEISTSASSPHFVNEDVSNRLNKVVVLFNEVDRAAKRLEQLTEQRREKLRELTRQRALEEEMNEVTYWIQNDGNERLQRFDSVQVDCEDSIKDHEQEFEKYYFISMKHLAKGRDLHDAASDLDSLKMNASTLKDCLQNFSERLETSRERIEGAARLHHLVRLELKEDDVQQEMLKLAEKIGVPGFIEKYRRRGKTENARTLAKPSRIPLPTTSTPEKLKTPTEGGLCHCWRDEPKDGGDEFTNCAKSQPNHEEDEEEHSKIADSGLGGCDRCEGNSKLTRACSCQSFDEAGNIYDKSDELEEDCFENTTKRFLDAQSPIEANSHLQCHTSSLELPQMEDGCGLDPKIQKTLLLIMREMIGTERDYVRSLYYVIENYMDELLRDDIPQPMRGQRNVIFGNIEKIFEFHQPHFLAELERYDCNPLKVGAAFLENESKFYLYALYNKNKPKSDTLMSEYATSFFKSKQLELNDKMDLASYLLKPVQRMGKYALLLQQLVKACSNVQGPALQEIAADVEELQRAEEMVKFQLRHGNDLLAMDSLRDCDVNVKEQGRLLRQNEFLVWQGRGGKKTLRQVFLFEELVLFSKARRFPDHKNLDIYIYKSSIKTSDIGLTAHVSDSSTKFEIWFRKRKPDDTWTLQSMSEDIKNAWTDEISKLLWKQAKRNREIRLAEMSSMGIGSKPCLDIRPSHNQISDRSITFSQLGKAPKFRNSFAGTTIETKSNRRPNSLISISSMSSGTSSSSLSTGTMSSNESNPRTSANTRLELINETTTLGVMGSGKKHQRSTTLVSQLSMESGILADISMSPDADAHNHEPNWPATTTINSIKSSTQQQHSSSEMKSTAASHNDVETIKIFNKINSEINLNEPDDPYTDSITVHL